MLQKTSRTFRIPEAKAVASLSQPTIIPSFRIAIAHQPSSSPHPPSNKSPTTHLVSWQSHKPQAIGAKILPTKLPYTVPTKTPHSSFSPNRYTPYGPQPEATTSGLFLLTDVSRPPVQSIALTALSVLLCATILLKGGRAYKPLLGLPDLKPPLSSPPISSHYQAIAP
jgi:hypothetical protein